MRLLNPNDKMCQNSFEALIKSVRPGPVRTLVRFFTGIALYLWNENFGP